MKKLLLFILPCALCLTTGCGDDKDSMSFNDSQPGSPLKIEQSTYHINTLQGGTFVITASHFCHLSGFQVVPFDSENADQIWTAIEEDRDYHLDEYQQESSNTNGIYHQHTMEVNDWISVTHRYSGDESLSNDFIVSLLPQPKSYQLTFSLSQFKGPGAYAFVNATK